MRSWKLPLAFCIVVSLALAAVAARTSGQERKMFVVQDVTFARDHQKTQLRKIIETVNSKEFKFAAGAVASLLGIPPGDVATSIGLAQISEQSTKGKGKQDEFGIWRSPPGYTMCRADFLRGDATSRTNFQARVIRGVQDDGLGFYSSVPYTVGGQSIKLNFRLTFISAADPPSVKQHIKDGTCQPANLCPCECAGSSCKSCKSKGPPCVPVDQLPVDQRDDRWLTGRH